MIKKYYEVSYDNCGNPDYLGYKPNKQDLIRMDWIVYKNKHFCCKECKEEFIIKKINEI